MSSMDEYFVHKCVTADAPPSDPSALSAWSQTARCELVVVQENQHACSASRAVFAAIVDRTLQSHKTSAVILSTLDTPLLPDTSSASPKLVHVDYSSRTSLARALLEPRDAPQTSDASLIATLRADIMARLTTVRAEPAGRSVVVAIDSVNALLAHHSLQDVVRFLQQLRQTLRIGSVVVRLNASAAPGAVQQALTAASTAVALVETPSSLRAYPLLAKERRRDVPKNMHGLVLLLRHKKNGRSSESVDYFQIHGTRLTFVPAADMAVAASPTPPPPQQTTLSTTDSSRDAASAPSARPEAATPSPFASGTTAGSTTPALPVRQEDVSFNLSISVEEQLAKSRVQLPYMHQGPSSSASSSSASGASVQAPAAPTNLFFIDDDDPDWDDDDLDDDLDI